MLEESQLIEMIDLFAEDLLQLYPAERIILNETVFAESYSNGEFLKPFDCNNRRYIKVIKIAEKRMRERLQGCHYISAVKNAYSIENHNLGLLNLHYCKTADEYKLEAIKNQGARSDLTSPQLAAKFRSDDEVAKGQGISGDTVRRYIRLTNLIPELLELVDQKKISFNPAVELSYLADSEQRDFFEAMQDTQNAPSLSQAQRIKKLSQEGKCSYEAIYDIMGEEKKAEMDRVTIKNDVLRKYFPKSYTPRQMEETILKLLEQWQKKRQRNQER